MSQPLTALPRAARRAARFAYFGADSGKNIVELSGKLPPCEARSPAGHTVAALLSAAQSLRAVRGFWRATNSRRQLSDRRYGGLPAAAKKNRSLAPFCLKSCQVPIYPNLQQWYSEGIGKLRNQER